MCADYDLVILCSDRYIPSYTMYSLGYTEIYHPLLGIRLKPSCEPILSRLPACAVHRLRLSSSPQSARWTGPQGGAYCAQTSINIVHHGMYCYIPTQTKNMSQHVPQLTNLECHSCIGLAAIQLLTSLIHVQLEQVFLIAICQSLMHIQTLYATTSTA